MSEKRMVVGVEMYFEFDAGEQRAFRCFVPQYLDALCNEVKTVSMAFGRLGFLPAQFATLIVDLSNNQVLKDRYGRFVRVVGDEVFNVPATDADVREFRSTPISDFCVLEDFVQSKDRPVIASFFGEHRFLSNFYPSEFVYEGIVWPHVEAAYQAMKSLDRSVWIEFSHLNANQAKQAGKLLKLRTDWDDVKRGIMLDLVYLKFNQNPELKQKLLDTGKAILQEGNTWGDKYWGVCPPGTNNGENHLGKILMEVRSYMRARIEF